MISNPKTSPYNFYATANKFCCCYQCYLFLSDLFTVCSFSFFCLSYHQFLFWFYISYVKNLFLEIFNLKRSYIHRLLLKWKFLKLKSASTLQRHHFTLKSIIPLSLYFFLNYRITSIISYLVFKDNYSFNIHSAFT